VSDDILDQARALFFAEAREMCEQIETSLLQLEEAPSDRELLNALFRAAHTIKGSAGLFGLDPVVRFTHHVENALDRLRDGVISLDIGFTSLLFECSDHIKLMLGDCEETADGGAADPAVDRASTALVERLAPYTGARADANPPAAASADQPVAARPGLGHWHLSLRFATDTFRDGFDPLAIINYLATLGEILSVRVLSEPIPGFDALDPESCHLGFEIGLQGPSSKEQIESALDLVRESCTLRIIPPDHKVADFVALIESSGNGAAHLGDILVDSGAITRLELERALTAQNATPPEGTRALLGELLVQDCAAPATVVDAALTQQTRNRDAKSEEARFVRVRADKLDELINLVGELVIASAGTTIQAQKTCDSALVESTLSMGRLIEEIRNGALSLRMVPIGETFARFKRVVRDVAGELSKEVSLEIVGAETELDKSVVEHIGDPLMHLVRNALDHGMETPDEREAAGKPRCGRVVLSACHDSGGILIRIEDDGRGIRRDKVLAKAIEKGLVPPGATPSDTEIDNLIFEAGFSTADKVTNLSGRGVGMDVVRRNIEGLRGAVRIKSVTGGGTTVEIRLPLTLAIIDGFLVRVGDCSFVIPLDHVIECIDGTAAVSGAANEVTGMLALRDAALPVVHLHRMFGIQGEASQRQSVVVVRNGADKAGLVVDHLLGEFQTVIKPLGKMFRNVRGIAGSTILGSGEVGLILDIASLTDVARAQSEARLQQAPSGESRGAHHAHS
jgi:two-component system chemotaxis sensor kinase CheA